MDYIKPISFGNITDKSEILDIMTKITDTTWAEKESIIKAYNNYIPTIPTEDGEEKDVYYLYAMLQTSILYWEEYNLIGIHGPSQHSLSDRLPICIEFQNAYDSDYEYSLYEGIPYFEKLTKQVQNASTQEILNHVHKYMDEDFTMEELLEDEDYMRKTVLYHIIEESLQIQQWIAGETPTNCQIFNVTPFNNVERIIECEQIINPDK